MSIFPAHHRFIATYVCANHDYICSRYVHCNYVSIQWFWIEIVSQCMTTFLLLFSNCNFASLQWFLIEIVSWSFVLSEFGRSYPEAWLLVENATSSVHFIADCLFPAEVISRSLVLQTKWSMDTCWPGGMSSRWSSFKTPALSRMMDALFRPGAGYRCCVPNWQAENYGGISILQAAWWRRCRLLLRISTPDSTKNWIFWKLLTIETFGCVRSLMLQAVGLRGWHVLVVRIDMSDKSCAQGVATDSTEGFFGFVLDRFFLFVLQEKARCRQQSDLDLWT